MPAIRGKSEMQLSVAPIPIWHCANPAVCYADVIAGENSMAARFVFAIACLLALVPVAFAQSGGDPTGVWLTQAGDARVKVSRCGGGICGVVVWQTAGRR
jgi:uncharacterized protein (DUF2147 family)